MLRYIESTSNDPYTNIALENALYETADDLILYLWVNQPSVIAGVNQNSRVEWNPVVLKQEGILPVRRLTGGGCVYHDYGNLNFSFCCKKKDADFDRFLHIIKDALLTFHINALQSGRNDLTVDNKKICGTAWMNDDEQVLFHGCILVDVDLSQLTRALTPSSQKLKGKGIESVRSRVTNLKDINPSITMDGLKASLLQSFEKEYNEICDKTYTVDLNQELVNQLKSDDWIYQFEQHPTLIYETQLKNANICLEITLNGDIMKKIQVATDSLDIHLKNNVISLLQNKPYEQLEFLLESLK